MLVWGVGRKLPKFLLGGRGAGPVWAKKLTPVDEISCQQFSCWAGAEAVEKGH
jgi:hypothetical protein